MHDKNHKNLFQNQLKVKPTKPNKNLVFLKYARTHNKLSQHAIRIDAIDFSRLLISFVYLTLTGRYLFVVYSNVYTFSSV